MKLFTMKPTHRGRLAIALALVILAETVFPTAALALTSGPSAPEFSSFEPVATTNMVNEFSGDFTYNIPVLNIPGANGGGYALSLSYHSGESPESEASWVGYGWTLNPGSINRAKRGFADDTKSTHVFYNDVPKNWTVTDGLSAGDMTIYSTSIPATVNASLHYNNYKGFGYTAGIGYEYAGGVASLGYSISDGTSSFSAKINPGQILANQKIKKAQQELDDKSNSATTKEEVEEALKDYKQKVAKINNSKSVKGLSKLGEIGSAYGMHALSDIQSPAAVTPYTGTSFHISNDAQFDPTVFQIGITIGQNGGYTSQENIKERGVVGYGYMYSHQAYSDATSMMDYFSEKDSQFDKRDRYLAIPFSNADEFSVTGEGMSGGFRLHSRIAGRFRPNEVESQTTINQITAAVNIGLDVGVKGTVGIGVQTLRVSGDDWGLNTGSAAAFQNYKFSSNYDEAYFMRFSDDLGGTVDYDANNTLVTATVSENSPVPGAKICQPNLSVGNALTSTIDGTVSRSGRSSYIAYHTNSEMQVVSNSKPVYAYDKSASTSTLVSTFRTNYPDQIGEIATVNEEGNTYVYGLPVYSENEKNLQYDMQGLGAGHVVNRFISYKDINGGNKMTVGSSTADPYASTFLLTQITTPDYVDRTMNGPTPDDFGGYTKFVYKRTQNQYHWRMPYQGFYYNSNDLSDPVDDAGSYSSGDKQIYYLDTIVTKTYLAVFKRSARADGYDAASDDVADNSSSAHGSNTLDRLDGIELYTNNNGAPGKLVKAVRFRYDYSLCGNVLNRATSGGKLTLKELWFEYEGVVPARISSYKFNYQYTDPINYPAPYTSTLTTGFSEYNNIINSSSPPTAQVQNPNYSLTAVDAWGNYQGDGDNRANDLRKIVDQTPASNFDPAAWQLKSIVLPSGGEIDIEYEQDDYLYVQDRRAMALVTLSSDNNGEANTFTLNVDNDLGYTTSTDKQALADLMNQELANDKIYFKFLYSLIGQATPALGQCNSEYVTGYVNFNGAGLDALGSLTVAVGAGGSTSYELPHQVCKDLVHKQKGGKLNTTGNCDPADGIRDGNSPVDVLMQLVDKIGTTFIPANVCVKINPQYSYLRIPMLKAKKGGGLRVKRILMFDKNGIDTGNPALYGTEYIYQTESGESSGVATNEPGTIREENALVTFLPKRHEQNFVSKAISGTDKEQFEGPIGESILPAASVGYSRVVAKNIHSGKTNVGYVVSEYFTCRDYPFDMVYNQPNLEGSGVQNTDINSDTYDKDWLNIPAVYVNYSVSNIWVAQGYRFIKNSMHGQPKSVSTYAGSYQSGSLAMVSKSSATEYEYFQPGEPIPVMAADGSTTTATPGKEMEMAFETRSVEDITDDGSATFDATVGTILPVLYIPQFSGSGSLSYTESKLRTHVTSKVITYPAIQKSVTTIQDGIYHKSQNTMFSAYTGKPIQVVTSDGFDGLNLPSDAGHNGKYTTYTIPGYSQYRELGQKAINERMMVYSSSSLSMAVQPVTGNQFNLVLTAPTPSNSAALCNALSALTVGDLLAVTTGTSTNYYFHVDAVSGTTVNLLSSGNYNATTPGGSTSVSSFEVLRSGRTNQVGTNIGSYTVYGATTSTVSSSNLTARQNFVNSMNAALATATASGVSDFIENTLSLNFGAGCQTGYKVEFAYAANQFTVNFASEQCINHDAYLKTPGQFALDNNTGVIYYYQTAMPCVKYPLSCINYCDDAGSSQVIYNVVASSAASMNHIWPYSNSTFDPDSINKGRNDYETGAKGKWRVNSNYVYKESIVGGATSSERIYAAAGTYSMTQYNWQNEALNDSTKWVRTSTVTKYSPNGDAIEEKDAIGVYSAAKFGYNYTMPYLVAKNATYGSVMFESFEKSYAVSSLTYLEDGLNVNASYLSTTYAHSGVSSYSLASNTFSLSTGTLTQQMIDNGASLKVWVKDPQYKAMPVKLTLSDATFSTNTNVAFVKIAQTGEWTLYEARITNWVGLTAGNSFNLKIGNNIVSQPNIWIDDVRFEPLDAQVNAYVYDVKTLRLLASFDDQHFGLYYQYNQEGKLIRKLIETERGIKTITETLYSTPTTTRTP